MAFLVMSTVMCLICNTGGTSSNGRALALHVRGTGIDAPVLHLNFCNDTAFFQKKYQIRNATLQYVEKNYFISTDIGNENSTLGNLIHSVEGYCNTTSKHDTWQVPSIQLGRVC